VSCLGRCVVAPAALVTLHPTGQSEQTRLLQSPPVGDYAARLRAIAGAHLGGDDVRPDQFDRAPFSGRIDPYLGIGAQSLGLERYAAARRFAEALRKADGAEARQSAGDQLVETLKTSDLHGMGGRLARIQQVGRGPRRKQAV
jgi:hypothetical protein